MKKLKQLNIAIILLLLVFQTVLSPISVFASETVPNTGVTETPETTDTTSPEEPGADTGTLEPPVKTEEVKDPGTPPTDIDNSGGTVEEGKSVDSPEQSEDPNAPTEESKATEEDSDLAKPEPIEEEALEEKNIENKELAEDPASEMKLGDMQGDIKMSFSGLRLLDSNAVLIKDATDLANYSGPNPKKGDTVYLNYEFVVNPTQDYGIGSKFTFQLPTNMIEEFSPGSFIQEKTLEETGGWAAYSSSYDSGSKTVTVTLNSDLETDSVGQIYFTFMAKFGNFANEDELEQEMDIPVYGKDNVKLPIKFTPSGSGKLLTKEAGTISRDADGTVTIPWTIWVNTAGKHLSGATLEDVIGEGHELKGKITVERYKVGLNGFNQENPGTPETFYPTGFPINLGDGYYAYKVTYETEVTADPTKSEMTYENTATLKSEGIENPPVNGFATVKYGPSLEKSKSDDSDKYKSTWTIKYNWLGQKIDPSKAQLTDEMTTESDNTGKHKIDYDSFKVFRVTLSDDGQSEKESVPLKEGTDYTLTKGDYGFTIDFNKPSNVTDGKVTSAFKIEYDTELEDEFVTDANAGTITNKVTRADGGEAKPDLTLSPGVFYKTGGDSKTIDYVNKTITWTLSINAEKELKNFKITDEFTTKNKDNKTLKHTLIPWNDSGEFYNVTGVDASDYIIKDLQGNDPNKGDEGFIVNFTKTIPKGQTVTIQYKTKYEVEPNGGVATAYHNTANATWKGTDGKDYEESRSAEYRPDQGSPTNKNGYKTVSVDNSTQEFSWGIGININKKDISNATVTDNLGEGHYIPVPKGQTLKDQITISKLKLTTEKGEKDGPLSSDKWGITEILTDGKVTGFTINFKDLDEDNFEAYLIEYKSKDLDDVYGQSSGDKRKYTNAATLKTIEDGSYEYSTTAEITEKANELIAKSAETKPEQDIINWTVTVNASNSKLGNITLKDKPSSNQKLLTNTFTMQEIKLNADGKSETHGDEVSIPPNKIRLDDDGGFSLDLGELDGKGYIIKYSTFFMGDGNGKGEMVSNEASIDYAGASSAGTSDKGNDSKEFKYSSSDTNASAAKGTLQLKKFKVNPLTGDRKVFEGVEFELWNKNNTIKLAEGTTKGDGTVTFEQVRYGKYTLREKTPTGYVEILPFEITMNATTDISARGKSYVIDNIEDIDLSSACTRFTITVNDIDGNSVANTSIKLLDENGVERYSGDLKNGQIKFERNEVQAGDYTVVDSNGKPLGKVTVKYGKDNNDDDCGAKLQPTNSCPQFTITLNDENDKSRPNVAVTLKDKDGKVIISTETDENGKIQVKPNPPAGKYYLYEGKQFLSEVNISYKDGCEIVVKQAPACPEFTLTVKDVDGKPREGVKVTIKNVDTNKTIEVKELTNSEGKVTIPKLEPGRYMVYDEKGEIKEFTVTTDCEATVQPAPSCPQFTLTVKDENGKVRPNVDNITIKDTRGAIIATNKTTNELGQITIPSENIPSGVYNVYQGDLFIGQITVKYSVNCEAEISAAPACPAFTLTVQTEFGTPNANAKITVKDANGNIVKGVDNSEVLTTSVAGTVVLPNEAIKQGTYYVYEGSRLIGSFTVKDTCSAIVKPSSTGGNGGGNGGGGGGGWTPNPGPNPDPEKPVDPNKPNPDPEKPVDPNKPNPDPEKPVDPNKPDPEKPVDPNKPNPDPEKPVDPNKPNPDPEKPVDPKNPGNPTTDTKNPTNPGKPETSKPSVTDVIDQGEKLPPYNPSTANKDTLDSYKDFLDNYNNLSKEEQEEVAKSLDIDKIKADAEQMEAQLKATGKLPQTDGANQTALTLVGVALVLGALFLLRRRKTEVK
ncbi:collagen binding domain-containing protein [Lysinibacillus sp. TE18511]